MESPFEPDRASTKRPLEYREHGAALLVQCGDPIGEPQEVIPYFRGWGFVPRCIALDELVAVIH